MRDFKDLKEEGEEGPEPKKPFSRTTIGLFGLLVFVLLFLFFSRNQEPAPPSAPPVGQIPAQPAAPPPPAPSPEEEAALKTSDVKPGEMRFDPKKGETSPPVASLDGQSAPSPTAQDPGGVQPKDDLTFFKTLKDKNTESVGLTPKKGKMAKAESPSKKEKPKKEFKVAKARIPPVRKTSSPALQSSGRYTIQVASFSEKQGADDLALRLKKKGYPSYVAVGNVPQKGTWYRVRIGHYSDRSEAQRAADRIHQAEKLDFFISSDGG